MTTKNTLLLTMILIAVISITTLPNYDAFAEDEQPKYKMVENVKSVITFHFRDGIEVHEFPVFEMTTDFVSNTFTTFEVEGVVGDAPYLHKALDEAFKYRLMVNSVDSAYDYQYRFFDVEVDILRDDEIVNSLGYEKCEIISYGVVTTNSIDYESYFSSKSGFATVDDIEFKCAGLNSNIPADFSSYVGTITDYTTEPLLYSFAEDVRTYVTFEFKDGIEKIEVPVFDITSGFGDSDTSGPSFYVEYVMDNYPILGKEIDNSRKLSGLPTSYNSDFDVTVDFANTEKILRELKYTKCQISGAEIVTENDKEEGYTGKSGFALLMTADFTCSGISSNNFGYAEMIGGIPVWEKPELSNLQPSHKYNLGKGPSAMVTFTYKDGVEKINFPIFRQSDVLDKSYPTFSLTGIVGDFPLLYEKVDEKLKIQKIQGSNSVEKFHIDVELMYGEESVRGFNYSKCRVLDYVVKTIPNKEESYVKEIFALENTFDFECSGYTPNNPSYDLMFDTAYAKTSSTNDLRSTDTWGSGFKVE